MQTRDSEESKFLNPTKTSIYLSLFATGLVMKLIALPGNSLIVLSSGFFYGHLCLRLITLAEKKSIHWLIFTVTSAIILSLMLFKYTTLTGFFLLAASFFISMLIELIMYKRNIRKQQGNITIKSPS